MRIATFVLLLSPKDNPHFFQWRGVPKDHLQNPNIEYRISNIETNSKSK